MKKVLIVSYYFPPINMVAARRYGTMCKYFEEYGYEPYVITTRQDRNVGWDVGMDLELPLDRKKIIKIGSSKGNCEIDSIFMSTLMDIMDSCKVASRALTRDSIGWYGKVKRSNVLEKIKDIDLVIGTYPPMGNLFVAKYLARKLGCPYIVDIRDLISDYTETVGGYRNCKWLDYVIEQCILRSAGGIVTVTPGFRDMLRKRYPGKRFQVVFNGWDAERLPEEKQGVEDKFLYYAGSLYQHRLESFELLVKCLKKINRAGVEKYTFIVRSIGPKELDGMAKAIVQREEMQEYVRILPSVASSTVQKEQKDAYINVVLSTVHREDIALMTTVPGKLYELLQEDTPILAVVPKQSDVEKILRYTQKGIASVSEEEIIDFILFEDRKCGGNEKVTFFTRKKQAQRLCKFMDRVLENT